MTTRFHALATMIVLLGTVTVAEAQRPESQLSVFVSVAPSASTQGDTSYDAATLDELNGSAVDVKNAITGRGIRGRRKHLVLAKSAAEAQLIVEIQARRSKFGLGLFGRNYYVLFALKPGGLLRPETPVRVIEASGKGSWKVAGAVVASLVDEYARDHADALVRSMAQAR